MRLYRLIPIGIGTVSVESLSSYYIRLATVHGLSPNQFRALVGAQCPDTYRDEELGRGDRLYIQHLVELSRPNGTTRALLNILSDAVRVQMLRSCTFQALGAEFGRQHNIYRKNLAWCPDCLAEQFRAEMPRHYKLLWILRDYQYCHMHYAVIMERCPHCKRLQNSRRYRPDLGTCWFCGRSLAACSLEGDLNKEAISRIYSNDLIELVEEISQDATLSFNQEKARSAVEALFNQVWEREEERRLWELIPRDECLAIIFGQKPLTLPILRRVAYRIGVRLPPMMRGVIEPWTPALNPEWLHSLPSNLAPKRRRRKINRRVLLDGIHQICSEAERPLPLVSVAKKSGVSVGAIEYHFPDLAAEIKLRYQLHQQDVRSRKRELARQRVFEYQVTHQRVSRKDALRWTREQTGLPYRLLRDVIRQFI